MLSGFVSICTLEHYTKIFVLSPGANLSFCSNLFYQELLKIESGGKGKAKYFKNHAMIST